MRTLTPIFSIIIAIIVFVAFVRPQYAEITGIKVEIQEYTNAIDKYNQFSTKLTDKLSIKTNMPAYKNERLDRLVPETIDDAQLLVDIKEIAKRHNLLFGNIQVENGDAELVRKTDGSGATPEVGDDLKKVDISFETIGTYDQFKEFLTDLENSLTLFEVTKISFTTSDSVFQQFELTVRTYSLPKM